MNKYASEYFNSLFSKIARQFSPEVLEPKRRAMGDPSIGAPTAVQTQNPLTPARNALTAPSIKPNGAGVAVPPVSGSVASPSNWSRLMMKGVPTKNLVSGGLAGAGIGLAADAAIPQFSGGDYLSEVGNQLRSFGIDTASSAAGAGIASGGAGLLPGAIWGAGTNAAGKLMEVGYGLNELYNPNSQLNRDKAESDERNKRLDAQNALRKNPMPPVAPNNGGRLSDGQLANMAGVGFAGDLTQNAITNANQATALPPINTNVNTNNGSTPTTPTPAATPSGSVSNEYPSPVPSPLPSPLPAPVQPSTTTIESTPTISNTPSTTVTPQQAAPATVPQTVAKPQAVVKSQSKPKANTPLKNVNFKPQTPNPVLKPSVIKPNTVQNSRLGGPLGTVSNVFGRIGDTMQNAASGRLGKGDQLRQTSLLPWQNKRR
jgi:hypothetical protein